MTKVLNKDSLRDIIEQICKNDNRKGVYQILPLAQLKDHMDITNNLNIIAWYYFNNIDYTVVLEETEKMITDYYKKYGEHINISI